MLQNARVVGKYDNTIEAWNTFIDHRTHYFYEIRRMKAETQNKLLAQMGETIK